MELWSVNRLGVVKNNTQVYKTTKRQDIDPDALVC